MTAIIGLPLKLHPKSVVEGL
uniref:Uncharacterized protein n=1 Tax=Lepeophtheirus salmonis TaxID=72036 RepID=A0A0K2U3T2_LEPSM